jgi:hypothetical protein
MYGASGVYGQNGRVPFRSRAATRHAVNTGIVDDRVHSANGVDLLCDPAGFGCAREIAYDDIRTLGYEVAYRPHAVGRPRVKDDLMVLPHERFSRRLPEPFGATRYEDA